MTTNYDSWLDRDLPDDGSDDEDEDAATETAWLRIEAIEERSAELVDWIAASRHEINVALADADLVRESEARDALADELAEYAALDAEHKALCNEHGFY